ncbi:MAG TPA: thiamine-phosphate kinase [Longimicrobiaceae bacterium]|nr:thiamine-phosphate kinase [Longimicrobiaceae bacterium]
MNRGRNAIPDPSRPVRRPPGRPAALGPGAEFDLIRRFLPHGAAAALPPEVWVGPGDDCAVVSGEGIALSTDLSVEGIHFRRDWLSDREIGFRAAAGALSDLAAVAARPIGVLVSLALPERDAGSAAAHLMEGVRKAAAAVGAVLLGGDVSRSPGSLVVDVVVVGECPSPVLRSGAVVGDEVWVTGELGGSAAAVAALLRGEEPDRAARERFAAPMPRVHEALWLAERGLASAMIDLSDGLAGDAGHLAAASGVAVMLSPEVIPVHRSVRRVAADPAEALRLALGGGEDYELCFTSPLGAMQPHAAEFEAAHGVRLTSVGRIGGGDGVWFVDAEGRRSPPGVHGWRHFEEPEREGA